MLGLNPYSTACLMNTSDLSTQIMKQMCVADDTDADLYIRHLALLVRRLYIILCYWVRGCMTLYMYSASLLEKLMKTVQSITVHFVCG